jgi:hypothetical protein
MSTDFPKKEPSADKLADTGSGGTEVKNLMVREDK